MNEQTKSKKQKDSLQIFLIFAAIVLVALYLLEEWRSSTVEEGARQAEAFTKKLSGNCLVHSSGLKGDLFVISCPDEREADALADRVRSSLKLEKFIVKTSYAHLLCETKCLPIDKKDEGI